VIRRILVAVDGSETADRALDFALDLAEKYSAEITLVTVFVPPSPSQVAPAMIFAPTDTTKIIDELKISQERVLSRAFRKAKRFKAGLEISKMLLQGMAADKIVETAKEGVFDLVVMGSRGLGGMKELFLGSVSDKVADEAPCPVLIVKELTSSG